MADTSLCNCCGHVYDKLALHSVYAGEEFSATICDRCAKFFWRVVDRFRPAQPAVG